MAVENPSSLPRVAEQRGSVLTHSPNILHGIRPDVAQLLFYRCGGTKEWRRPMVFSALEKTKTVSTTNGQTVVRAQDMLDDMAVVFEPWRSNTLMPHLASETEDETALAVAVIETERYVDTRLPYETKATLQERYHVLPLDNRHILFQGLLRDARPEEIDEPGRDSMSFEYMPIDIITGEEIPEGRQIAQRQRAKNYLLLPHPSDQTRTPMELLVGGGKLV
ncbi:MAG: hypothetical protein ACM3IJ_00175 [Candidatus Levyibacteriota bacterium]